MAKSASFSILLFLNYWGSNHAHKLSWKHIYYSKSNNGRGKHPPNVEILGWKLPYDLPLVKRVFPAKFHCIWSYRVQIHNEQTNTHKHSSLYIDRRYRYTLEVKVLDQKVLLDPRTAQRGKSGKRVVEQSEKSLNFLKNRRNFRMVFQKTWEILPQTPPPVPPTSSRSFSGSLNFLKNRRNFCMVFQKTWKILPKTLPTAPPIPSRPSSGWKGIPCQISLHLVVPCPNA